MKVAKTRFVSICIAAALIGWSGTGWAQKSGGTLRIQHMDTPPSASIHEESTVSVAVPFMAIYNNLVVFDQNVPKNSLESIVPDLATGWETKDEGRKLVFKTRDGVKWHDGKPFSAADVACTFDLILTPDRLRRNPRRAWYTNVEKVTADGPSQVTFHLKQPQPSLLALLASGYTPIYPCHVPAADMRRKPVGTGPFKLADFRMNEGIKLVKNPDYWKPGRPYLDAIEFSIIADRSTRMLSFVAGRFDMTFPADITVPLLKNIKRDAPQAQCTMRESGVSTNLIINREVAPFDNPKIRRAMALTLDRDAFIRILSEGEGRMGGALLPPPDGVWGLPAEKLKGLIGYGDVDKSREEARTLMKEAGYGPDKRLKLKVSTRNIATFKDPAVILIDQLKQIWIDAELEIIDTTIYYNRVFKKDYVVALNLTGSAVDDPDVTLFEGYACGSLRNYNNYCDPEMTKLFEEQSRETDRRKRQEMVWEIDRKLQEDVARPIISHGRIAGCWQPHVKNVTLHINSIYNNWRFEDVWLDR
ncbi:ABC transporter substrate-binding protein [Reyranella sp.]|jgi:peptide/nickel transport system substrate-binding protein|uniref:ABC transporter substrate-binding protein n=1 Tax=Reyranella sp. TaxID=1929291 RepID=UPI000BDB1C7F|nr:ABC transporter substrate-binding protein [Reyranella sp.]OYY36861.1 MAG: peptide ABC transporter substrate-binding protein [Rhodospirillales bacterium 35-66-84]OYZ91784.1 MAG: peptide ABC transporter substrate-binding protein [Rhodospirillales bacterium 24-66-33]OZB23202.1 MAG: peptide ABC transporter substrate-binding protein [Rhodospirillales bacterium 39-66-50]HQS18301.1 ABC transporter substrate-binding protein [Reyranella sp.]HQT09860.1 ABC transporter substrate-binding protein [Reyra